MSARTENIAAYFTTFVIGAALALGSLPAVEFFHELAFGFEIHSVASFPYFHNAKVRTRPGIGNQTLFLEVDEADVWQSGDMPPGDLREELSWDADARVVTLKLQGKPFISYDVESKTVVEVENAESLTLE